MITGTVALNGGDAAILQGQRETLCHAFRDPTLVVFDHQAEATRRYYPDLDFRPALFWMRARPGLHAGAVRWGVRLVRLLAAAVALRIRWRWVARRLCPSTEDFRGLQEYALADVVMTCGGTMLVEHYQFLPRLVDYAATLVLGRPLVFFTQSLGPYRRWTNRTAVAAVLRRSRLVLVRGEESRRNVLELGVPAEVVCVAPDAAFLLADEHLAAQRRDRPIGGPLRIGLSLRDWPFFRTHSHHAGQARYEDAVGELCTWVVRELNAEVTCLSTCQGIPEYWADDSRTALRMADRLPPDVRAHVEVDRVFRRPTELRDRLAEFDVMVATRLHAAILSLCAGTPAVVIEYERKASEVFEQLRLADWVVDIEHLDGSALIDVVGRLVDGRMKLAEEVTATAAEQRRGALKVAERLRNLLDHAGEQSG